MSINIDDSLQSEILKIEKKMNEFDEFNYEPPHNASESMETLISYFPNMTQLNIKTAYSSGSVSPMLLSPKNLSRVSSSRSPTDFDESLTTPRDILRKKLINLANEQLSAPNSASKEHAVHLVNVSYDNSHYDCEIPLINETNSLLPIPPSSFEKTLVFEVVSPPSASVMTSPFTKTENHSN
jgi:hypothetical protein